MKVTILGCGTSTGVPRIGNDWGDCDPKNPKNRRSRASILVEADGFKILVDTGPDLREQLLRAGVSTVDAVIWTHDHADHCHGIDDLRQIYFQRRRPVPGYANSTTLTALKSRFGYVFEGNDGYPATVDASTLLPAMQIGPFIVRSTEQPHGPVTSTGLCFSYGNKRAAYAIDFSALTDDMIALYSGVDVLVIDCLRQNPHPTHAHLDMTIDVIQRVEPNISILSHMDKSMDYAHVSQMLPPNICPAHDGLEVLI